MDLRTEFRLNGYVKVGDELGHLTIPDTQDYSCRLIWGKQRDLNETGKLIVLLLWDPNFDQDHKIGQIKRDSYF